MTNNDKKLQVLSTTSLFDLHSVTLSSQDQEGSFKLSTLADLMAIPRGTTMGLIFAIIFLILMCFSQVCGIVNKRFPSFVKCTILLSCDTGEVIPVTQWTKTKHATVDISSCNIGEVNHNFVTAIFLKL